MHQVSAVITDIFRPGKGEPHFHVVLTVALAEKMQQCMDKMESQPRWWMWANLRVTAEDSLYMRVHMGEPEIFFIPHTCRLLLKDCYVDSTNWMRLGCATYRSSLFCIPITEIEVVNLRNMNTGHITKVN